MDTTRSVQQFFQLYKEGALDDDDHLEAFAEWSGHYRLRLKRQEALEQISSIRLADLRRKVCNHPIQLTPADPVLDLS